MRNYLNFLYYYTFAAITGSFIWAFFLGPRPEALLLVIFLSPVALYFTVKISRRNSITQDTTTPTHGTFIPPLLFAIILSVLFISSFSIYAYLLLGNIAAKNNSIPYYQIEKDIKDIKEKLEKLNSSQNSLQTNNQELEQIKKQIEEVKSASKNPVLGTNTASASAIESGFITVTDKKNSPVNIYASKSTTSKITGTLKYGQDYLYSKIEGTWFFVMTIEGNQGWVNNKFVELVTTQ